MDVSDVHCADVSVAVRRRPTSGAARAQEGQPMKVLRVATLIPLLVAAQVETAQAALPLDPSLLTKYVDPLPKPAQIVATGSNNVFDVTISEFDQQLHRDLPPTTVWGYNGSYPGPTIQAFRWTPVYVTYLNELFSPTLLDRLPVDQTLHWADPYGISPSFDPYFGPVPAVTHSHGGENHSASDGHPEAWFTPFYDFVGPKWSQYTYEYLNTQEAATLWYHDHALGMTRLNVWGGLAGFYIVNDPCNEPKGLPKGEYDREIVIQDRLFDTDGQILYPVDPPNPDVHPFWTPEGFGDTIVVNGKIWPFMEVEPRKYRFRLLNGSNARFYNLSIDGNRKFVLIGVEGGYLDSPSAPLSQILLAPAERADVVVDFSGLDPGTSVIVRNDAPTPFPNGLLPDPNTTGQIMEFRVVPLGKKDKSKIPAQLRPNNPIVPLTSAPIVKTRTLTLNEVLGPGGPLGLFLDGKMWEAPVTEKPLEGTTELWELVNLTGDTHPIHIHLVHFQVLNHQPFDVASYSFVYNLVNPIIPVPPVLPYFTVPLAGFLTQGAPQPPLPTEEGWKDTVQVNPGEVTRVLVRYAPQDVPAHDITGTYAFDASTGPGYVWHCHILEHEDNEMMRPFRVMSQ